MNKKLTYYEEDVFMNWYSSISNKVADSLNKTLIIRKEDTIRVNFSYDLSSLLREVGYLKKEFPYRDYPETAEELFKREATFRSFTRSLDITVDNYNRLKTTTKKVEYNLIGKMHALKKYDQFGQYTSIV